MMPKKSKPKKKKVSHELDTITNMPDIISNMHDSMLSHILSFLPTTKDVVATSILSTRWKYVWTGVDKLVFDFSGFRDEQKLRNFTQFVYRVLQFHQGIIKALKLHSLSSGCKKVDVTHWINTAIFRGLERLDVKLEFNFPFFIFFCKTLVDLKITSYTRHHMIMPPSGPIFPALKKLYVSYLYCDIRCLSRIITQCPTLEHLIVNISENPIEIVSSSMKRLELHIIPPIRYGKTVLLGVQSLEFLQLECTLPTEFIVTENLSSLIEAELYLREMRNRRTVYAKELRDSFGGLIRPLSNVKVLRIDCQFQRFLDFSGHVEFLNLTKLEIVSYFFEWRLLVHLMEVSSNLQAISLEKKSTEKRHKLVWKEPKKVPTCLSSSLKKISMYGFTKDELPVMKYVLRTAKILERMDIKFASCFGIDDLWKADMVQTIQKLYEYKESDRCQVWLVEEMVGRSFTDKWESRPT